MKYALALVAAAGFAATANAQNTKLVFETSTDGTNWQMGTRNVSLASAAATQTVYVRVRAQYVQGTGGTSMGLAGITYQPTLSNFNAADVRVAFANEATGGQVDDSPTATGRIAPFGSAGQGSASASGLLTSFVDAGNSLRFAGSKATTLTTNLAWGVNSSQVPQQLSTQYNSNLDVVIFKYAVTLSGAGGNRTLLADAPLSGINNARGTWYTSPGGTNSILAPVDATTGVMSASIAVSIVPAPASMALLGLGGLVAGRRRR